jgi:hypothetical protein
MINQKRIRILDLRIEHLPYYSGRITEVKAVDDTEVFRVEIQQEQAHPSDFRPTQQVMAVNPSRQLVPLEIVSVVAKPREFFSTVTLKLTPEQLLDGEGEWVPNLDFAVRDSIRLFVLSEAQKTVPAGITTTLVPDRLDEPTRVFEDGTTQKAWDTNFDGDLDHNEGEALARSIERGLGVDKIPQILKNFKAIHADYVPAVRGFSKTTALIPFLTFDRAVAVRLRALNIQQCRMYIDLPVGAAMFRGLKHDSVTKKFTNVCLIDILKDARKVLGQWRQYPEDPVKEDKEEKKIRRRQEAGAGVDPTAAQALQHALDPYVEAQIPVYLMSLIRKDGSLFMERMKVNKILAIRSKKGITYRLVSEPVDTPAGWRPIEKPFDVQVGSILVERGVGMVFQKPNPFPSMTIGENVLSGRDDPS